MDEVNKNSAWKFVPALTVILIAFLAVQIIGTVKGYKYIGGDSLPQNVITVTGEGKIFAVPDIATFSFSVMEEGKTVKEAQDKATVKMDTALKALKDLGIDDKDIKTSGYNAYPKYETNQIYCITYPCPQGRQEIVGYEVNQNITVKVRKVDDAGKAIDAITSAGASNVSGINFTIDDEDALVRDARQEAIADAREKAKELANDLDVKLVRIVNFSENGRGYPTYYKAEATLGMGGADMAVPAPTIPVGENEIVSSVTITYEIR